MIHSWGNHFGKRTKWSLLYFLIYVYLNILAQSQILVISLYMNLQKNVIKYKDHLSGRHFYWRRWLGLKLWEFYVDVSDAMRVGSQKGIFEVRKFLYSHKVSNFSPSLTSFLWKRCTPHGSFFFNFHTESQLVLFKKIIVVGWSCLFNSSK